VTRVCGVAPALCGEGWHFVKLPNCAFTLACNKKLKRRRSNVKSTTAESRVCTVATVVREELERRISGNC
jgi:DNA polymerase III delta subunit